MSPKRKSVEDKRTLAPVLVHSLVRRTYNTADFVSIAQAILGKKYELSIVLIGDARSRALNQTYRQKSYPANVLSFPLSKDAGEIFLNTAKVQREAHQYGLTSSQHLRYLLIHGCLHLRGYRHGSTMERAEQTFLKRFVLR